MYRRAQIYRAIDPAETIRRAEAAPYNHTPLLAGAQAHPTLLITSLRENLEQDRNAEREVKAEHPFHDLDVAAYGSEFDMEVSTRYYLA